MQTDRQRDRHADMQTYRQRDKHRYIHKLRRDSVMLFFVRDVPGKCPLLTCRHAVTCRQTDRKKAC